MALITIKNLTFKTETATLFSNLNFKIEKGDYLVVVGENGSGKTTLMNLILGLKNNYTGEIIFGDGLTKKDIGFLPQAMLLKNDFPASCEEIVLSGLISKMHHSFYTAEDKKICTENMRRLDILNLRNKSYNELSGGQRQRVLLARALSATKDILFLDEPVTGLDPYVTQDLYKIIKTLNEEGITIVMISHDVNEVFKYATHILHIGKDIFYGTKNEYIKSNFYSYNKENVE